MKKQMISAKEADKIFHNRRNNFFETFDQIDHELGFIKAFLTVADGYSDGADDGSGFYGDSFSVLCSDTSKRVERLEEVFNQLHKDLKEAGALGSYMDYDEEQRPVLRQVSTTIIEKKVIGKPYETLSKGV